ncbi:MAG TPA: NADH-quinone oxidoreductase subunit N [Ktedonobacter sp.]|jgi:NADH-quinone oxidoreductase subunit N|nr:NADH-quinone oxidoreductase subunit N [Ktedonobacter sp.]HBE24412.1 NADH-quinone oxidoreductase subunit N [Ktedonobacter sp.]
MTFTYTVTAADWGRIAPELVLTIMALAVMIADILLPQQGKSAKESAPTNFIVLPLLSLLGLVGALAATIVLFLVGDHLAAFNQMVGSDYGSLYAYIIILSASILGILLSPAYLKRLVLVHQGEYYALFLFATVGMMLLAAATSFLTVFLGLEMFSLALYILCGYVVRRKGSQEAGMKYFLLSSFASAFLLYGIAFTYAATGNTSFVGIRNFLLRTTPIAQPLNQPFLHSPNLLLIAMGLLTVGFAFKVSAIPFQAWTPDVYDGAPAPVTAFMSVATKAAALIAFARVFDVVFHATRGDWTPVIWAIAILTIVGGNILALVQTSVKRLLAYSSIAHAGYLLIGVVVGSTVGVAAILFYLLCYAFMNIGAFGIVSIMERVDNSGSNYSELRGLWYRQPVLAGLLSLFMLALAGFPPMAGFAAKYYLFYAALQGGHPELLIIGVLASVLGMYYYLRVIAWMFMEKEVVAAPAASAAPVPSNNKKISGKLGDMGTPTLKRAAVAVAVKPAATPAVARPAKTAVAVVAEDQRVNIGWMSWVAIWSAAVGTFAMGTVLAFWLVPLAQQAAEMMFR